MLKLKLYCCCIFVLVFVDSLHTCLHPQECVPHSVCAGIIVWALASVLVEQTGGYSEQACERAALWVNMSQGHRVVRYQRQIGGTGRDAESKGGDGTSSTRRARSCSLWQKGSWADVTLICVTLSFISILRIHFIYSVLYIYIYIFRWNLMNCKA